MTNETQTLNPYKALASGKNIALRQHEGQFDTSIGPWKVFSLTFEALGVGSRAAKSPVRRPRNWEATTAADVEIFGGPESDLFSEWQFSLKTGIGNECDSDSRIAENQTGAFQVPTGQCQVFQSNQS